MSNAQHIEIGEGDEYFCPKCGKRWDIDDVRPPCATGPQFFREIKRDIRLRGKKK